MYEQIIIIAGVARSGTSWVGEIFDSSPNVAYRFQPLFSYAFKGVLHYNSTEENYRDFFNGIYFSKDEFLLQKDKRESGEYPEFKKNSIQKILAFKENRYQYLFPKMISTFDNIFLIGIIRHPCATISSWIANPKEFPPESDVEKEWRFGSCKNQGREEEFFGFYKWREIANLYLDLKDKFPEKVYILNYNNLVSNTLEDVEKMFNFLQIEVSQQTKDFIEKCNIKHIEGPYAVYKDKSVKDKWKSKLDNKIIDEIYFELKGTRLERFLND
jgi:hypothetical protein